VAELTAFLLSFSHQKISELQIYTLKNPRFPCNRNMSKQCYSPVYFPLSCYQKHWAVLKVQLHVAMLRGRWAYFWLSRQQCCALMNKQKIYSLKKCIHSQDICIYVPSMHLMMSLLSCNHTISSKMQQINFMTVVNSVYLAHQGSSWRIWLPFFFLIFPKCIATTDHFYR